ncbi:hypothetical protein ERX35_005085 [Macrococcus equipercicus]|uniref:Uncharacterized protein n=1 Tax=Macrococcus equipercicus TaxID=69967 RepID=A0ABQ6RAP7_9STAP|nr:hypothetical protein [Macrococcus equipercicus]KAA1040369.1 hypothetical protein ERX35_005085 [Macrococcus equipercicus]
MDAADFYKNYHTDEYHKKYDLKPIGEKITFEHFLHLLDTGREIEFYYEGELYFISDDHLGRVLSGPNHDPSPHYKDSRELLIKESLKGNLLLDIFENENYFIETVF